MKSHCKNGHEFTEENTYVPPRRPNVRICYECKNKNNREWHRRWHEKVRRIKAEYAART